MVGGGRGREAGLRGPDEEDEEGECGYGDGGEREFIEESLYVSLHVQFSGEVLRSPNEGRSPRSPYSAREVAGRERERE